MNKDVCYRCSISPAGHPFSFCMTATCLCACVGQLKNFCNPNQDDISTEHPRFLEINHKEALNLPVYEHQIADFNKVNKSEWLNKTTKKKK